MRTLLFLLIAFVAVTATLSGLFLIIKPDGTLIQLPLAVLKETPFKNFLIPGLVLMIVVGGVNVVAVFYNIQRYAHRYNWAIAGAVMLIGWSVVQMILIQNVQWLHFLYLGIGVFIILLAYQLKGKWAA